MSRWHQDVKLRNILVKSKRGGSPYDCEFKLADLGLSHFKKHVPSQREATDRDSYGTRTYGRLYPDKLPYSAVADGIQVPQSATELTATSREFAFQ